jgi:hypothetical protein
LAAPIFAGANGRLVATIDGVYQPQVDVDHIMSDDWICTIFDPNWVSSDRVENDLAALEGLASALFDELHAGAAVPTDEQWEQLCWFLALQACRHIDLMSRGHDRGKEMALALAEAPSHDSEASFLADMKARFGCDLPAGLWDFLKAKGKLA